VDSVLFLPPAVTSPPSSPIAFSDIRFPFPVMLYPGSFNPLHEVGVRVCVPVRVDVSLIKHIH
jgi:hypothetical protein